MSGKTLRTISVITLIVGISAVLVLLLVGASTSSMKVIIGPTVGVLFASLFMYALGKTIASIANYVEAIYKKLNPDAKYDFLVELNESVLPGDKAHYESESEKYDVTITDAYEDESGYYRYKGVKENGEEMNDYKSRFKPIE